MKSILQLPIISGEKTCASAPGEFCQYMRPSLIDDTKSNCYLFGQLNIENEWTMRHERCINSATLPARMVAREDLVKGAILEIGIYLQYGNWVYGKFRCLGKYDSGYLFEKDGSDELRKYTIDELNVNNASLIREENGN